MRTATLVTVDVLFAGMGLYALAAPAAVLRPFGLEVGTSTGRAEVRAVYGGFGLAMAGVLFWAAGGCDEMRTGAAVAVGVALAGMAIGRIISRVLDSATGFYPVWFYCSVEVVGAAVLIAAA